jgi:hypothetical protein
MLKRALTHSLHNSCSCLCGRLSLIEQKREASRTARTLFAHQLLFRNSELFKFSFVHFGIGQIE